MSWTVTGVSAAPGLLDTYSGAAAAYSLRRLTWAYGGPVVRVRRSSDNTEQDFTAAQVTDGTLTTFCGAGNGFVRTWYDQSGNGRNLIQTTTASQPQIVSSGALVTVNAKPAITFDGTDDRLTTAVNTDFSFLHTSTQSTIISVNRYGNTSNPDALLNLISTRYSTDGNLPSSILYGLDDRSSVPKNNAAYFVSNRDTTIDVVSRPNDALTPNNQALRFTLIDLSNATASLRVQEFINAGSAIGDNSTAVTTLGTSRDTQLIVSAGSSLDGGSTYSLHAINTSQEIIFYANNQSSNRVAIRDSINAHYSVY